MPKIHSLHILPEQSLIDSVASYGEEFSKESFNYCTVVNQINNLIKNNDFMTTQDHADWAKTRGKDYLYNPKLFVYAPLTYVCAFISELFKTFTVDKILAVCPEHVLHQALLRMKTFSY